MFAEVMRNDVYRAYRVRLEMFLPIPTDASDLDIHALIEAGFSPGSIKSLRDLGYSTSTRATTSFRSRPLKPA